MARLDGKVALITGAGKGMGQVASVLFAREGARIVVADFSEAGGRETVAAVEAGGGEAAFVKVDVANADQVEKMIEFAMARYGSLDVLYNNAGIFPADGISLRVCINISLFDSEIRNTFIRSFQSLGKS